MRRLVVDLDDTISFAEDGDYANAQPNHELIDRLRQYRDDGFIITIATARNMRTHNGNIGKINAETLPVAIDWLRKHNVPFDEIITGKPWCGSEGFYIDDKAIRPNEFTAMTYHEIATMLGIIQ